jgi:hypothetical protein
MGIDDPSAVRVHGFGGGMLPLSNNEFNHDDLPEVPLYFEKGIDGIFNAGDYILFYARGHIRYYYDADKNMILHQSHRYADACYYYVTSGGFAKTITLQSTTTAPATHYVTEFDDYAFHEVDQVNLIKSGNEFYEPIDVYPEYNYNYTFPNSVTGSVADIYARVVARGSVSSNFIFKTGAGVINTIVAPSVELSSHTYAATQTGQGAFTVTDDNVNIKISFSNPRPNSFGWLDYFTINVRRQLILNGSQMAFRDVESVDSGNVAEYTLSGTNDNVMIWDVTDPHNVRQLNVTNNGGAMIFRLAADSLREFVAFNSLSGYYTPVYQGSSDVGAIDNQNLHGLPQPDLIIVSNPAFINQAEQLAQIHRDNDGLDVIVVTPEDIYNEFSSGVADISAIRNFVRMFYDRAVVESEAPRYLLLMGDGSYDNKSTSGANTNYILTYQSDNSVSETASFSSDDFFVLLDSTEGGYSGRIDMGVGRFPVKSASEAQAIVDKIKLYMTPQSNGDWRNIITFIGDDEDNNLHMDQSDDLATFIENNYPSFNIQKIYLDAYQQQTIPSGERYPDVNNAFKNRMKQGALIINYTGHGGELGLAHERILEINDILAWDNSPRLPLFITASCEFSRYDDYARTAAGEYTLLNNKGGAIALLTTTRLVYASLNYQLNAAFYKYAFIRDTNNKTLRLGDIIRLTKSEVSGIVNKRNFSLLGDPALELAQPDPNVVTTYINGNDVQVVKDTMKALSKVTVSGYVADFNDQKRTDFSGIIYPTVFDKASLVKTLSNDGGSPFQYYDRNNIIYKGKASVENGDFSFSFIVPKDITYKLGTGKISYYAYNEQEDYNGNFQDFYVGSTADTIDVDNLGPEIELFMNDKSFVNGGMTDENPKLIAALFDSSGINTVGNGIGHDITLTIDEKVNNKLILNEFYEANLNSYTSGELEYVISDMQSGQHSVTLKAWDVFNNSSEQSLDFIVANSDELKLSHVFNYPNPFTTYTEFWFEHNQPDVELEVDLKIFTISGKLVKSINTTIISEGSRSNDISWNGLDDYGGKIGRGVYIYRLKVRTSDGKFAEKIEKLVILR